MIQKNYLMIRQIIMYINALFNKKYTNISLDIDNSRNRIHIFLKYVNIKSHNNTLMVNKFIN